MRSRERVGACRRELMGFARSGATVAAFYCSGSSLVTRPVMLDCCFRMLAEVKDHEQDQNCAVASPRYEADL